MKRLLISMVGIVGAGCDTSQIPKAFPSEFAQVVKAGAASAFDQAVWETLGLELEGHAQDPGLEVFYQSEHTIGSRISGFNGEVEVHGAGKGTGEISPEARAKVLEIVSREPDLAGDIGELLKLLGFGAEPAPEEPVNE